MLGALQNELKDRFKIQITSKLGNKKLIIQISHKRLLNQVNGCILLGT